MEGANTRVAARALQILLAERVSREKLETAILRQLTDTYRDGPLIHDALAAAQ